MGKDSVAVLCYTTKAGSIDQILLNFDEKYLSCIKTDIEEEGNSLLLHAQEVVNKTLDGDYTTDSWKYFGSSKIGKDSPQTYIFAVDITNGKKPRKGLYDLDIVYEIDDSITQLSVLRLVLSLHKKDFLEDGITK